jgi:acyl-CoA hydrolase
MTIAQQIYHSRSTTAAKAIASIQPGMRVFMTGNCSVPQTLMAAVVKRAGHGEIHPRQHPFHRLQCAPSRQ